MSLLLSRIFPQDTYHLLNITFSWNHMLHQQQKIVGHHNPKPNVNIISNSNLLIKAHKTLNLLGLTDLETFSFLSFLLNPNIKIKEIAPKGRLKRNQTCISSKRSFQLGLMLVDSRALKHTDRITQLQHVCNANGTISK